MKKIYNYILLSVLAIASAGCINEELTPDQPSAEAGDEVKFGLSLGDPKTRTIYGDETTIEVEQANGTTITKTVFPIYWIDGDKVQVFSPQCLEGKRSAEYKVVLPSGVTNPYYAEDLTPTGANGVQWGDNRTADFYSLYPSGSYTLSSDGTKAENITINYTQSINVNGDIVKSDMEDCLMYAKTTAVTRGSVVNLHYDPISTVVMVTLKVAENAFGTAAESFTVQSISLIAPDGTDIAGTFSLNISDGTFGEFTEGKASNTITTQIVNSATGGYHTLTNGQYVTVPLFLAPAEYTSVKDWKVQVVANGNTYTKTLGIDKPLEPGQIHKITLPELAPEEGEWDVSKWMTYIPRNVYLSEVSIPGSWNSLNGDFQDNTDITAQYAAGVRAFHIDTRWKRTGYFWDYEYSLGTADGGGTSLGSSDKFMTDDNNPTFEATLTTISNQVATDEYMIVICTFAQNSNNHESENGFWYDEISYICSDNDKIYDARNITPTTVVGDVLGKVIVIVNMPSEINTNTTLPADSKCFFANFPSELTADHFNTDYTDNYDELWTTGSSTNTAVSSDITMFNSYAQITSNTGTGITTTNRGYAPSITERDTILEAILNWSKANYGTENYMHDQWIYLGLGGYQVTNVGGDAVSDSYGTIAETYNTWIGKKVAEMGTTTEGNEVVPYYPVGIVLMNHATNYSDELKDILTLNNKYRLQYDSSKPSDYDPNALAASEYSATATTGGDAF